MRGILLAAGAGRRFDPLGVRDKLLEPMADGRPVLWHSARAMCAALPGSVAVVRPGLAMRVHWLREAGCDVVESEQARNGMGAALAAAVRASSTARGWVIVLGDMPWIPASLIAEVARAVDGPARVVAPTWGGRRGHPVGFGAAWKTPLSSMTGDHGARDLLRNAPVRLLETHEEGVLRDVDTTADLEWKLSGRPRSS